MQGENRFYRLAQSRIVPADGTRRPGIACLNGKFHKSPFVLHANPVRSITKSGIPVERPGPVVSNPDMCRLHRCSVGKVYNARAIFWKWKCLSLARLKFLCHIAGEVEVFLGPLALRLVE